MLTVFFDYRGVVHYKFLSLGQTVNKEYYLSVMCVCKVINLERPELWANNSSFHHYDNSTCHTAFVLRNFYANYNLIFANNLDLKIFNQSSWILLKNVYMDFTKAFKALCRKYE